MKHLRKLKKEDAPLMLEWMHDETVVRDLRGSFMEKNLTDCIAFIEKAQGDANQDLHLAIVSEADEYLGTVSLKHIGEDDAEFAIAIRAVAMGKGIAKNAMEEVLDIGVHEYSLKKIYWCVDPGNRRALRFYDKNDYQRTTVENIPQRGEYTKQQMEKYIWYQWTGD